MKKVFVALISTLVVTAFITTTSAAYPTLARKTGKSCSYCHTNPRGGKELTDAGKYWKKNKKLPPKAKKSNPKKPPAKKK